MFKKQITTPLNGQACYVMHFYSRDIVRNYVRNYVTLKNRQTSCATPLFLQAVFFAQTFALTLQIVLQKSDITSWILGTEPFPGSKWESGKVRDRTLTSPT